MAEGEVNIPREIDVLESELRRLENEYNMFFAGRLPRPPWETRGRVHAMLRRLDNQHITNYGDRFRFNTLQSRFSSFVDLWDRGLRAREEGRGRGPFGQVRPAVERERPPRDGIVKVTTVSDPAREADKVQELYEDLVNARRAVGQGAVPFEKFAELVRTQVNAFRAQGRDEVAFRVAVKDGKVAFTARALGEPDGGEGEE